MAQPSQPEALRGTLDLLVLKSLTRRALHGWGIGQWIRERSKGLIEVNQGSLYPALQRLEHKGWIESDWGPSEHNRRARFYRLTASGKRALGDERQSWRRFAKGVENVLQAG